MEVAIGRRLRGTDAPRGSGQAVAAPTGCRLERSPRRRPHISIGDGREPLIVPHLATRVAHLDRDDREPLIAPLSVTKAAHISIGDGREPLIAILVTRGRDRSTARRWGVPPW